MSGIRTCLYFTNWSVYGSGSFQPRDLPLACVSNVFYAFLALDATTGKLGFADEWADLQLPLAGVNDRVQEPRGCLEQLFALKRVHRHTKVSMSIGGWGTSHKFKTVVADPTKREAFIASCLSFLHEYGFDGIDLDWEYPETPNEGLQLAALLRSLREGLDAMEVTLGVPARSLLLTIAAPAAPSQANNLPVAEIDRHLSFWNLMCYDYAGAWSAVSGYHSHLFGGPLSTDSVIQYYLKRGVPPHKVVMGMPNYGRGFAETTRTGGLPFKGVGAGGGGEPGVWLYKTLPLPGTTEEFDSRCVSAYCFDPAQGLLITYDNHQSAKLKAEYVLSHGLGGGMWWEASGDACTPPARSTLLSFVEALGPTPRDATPNNLQYPTSTFTKRL